MRISLNSFAVPTKSSEDILGDTKLYEIAEGSLCSFMPFGHAANKAQPQHAAKPLWPLGVPRGGTALPGMFSILREDKAPPKVLLLRLEPVKSISRTSKVCSSEKY